MKKNPQTKEDTLWIFKDFHGVMWLQRPTSTPARKFYHLTSLTLKSSICCYVFKYLFLTDFFKEKQNAYFDRKFIKF